MTNSLFKTNVYDNASCEINGFRRFMVKNIWVVADYNVINSYNGVVFFALLHVEVHDASICYNNYLKGIQLKPFPTLPLGIA
jgi:hypothetical protein